MTAVVDPDLAAVLEAELGAAVALRQAIHREPRLGGDEGDSLARVATALADVGTLTPVAGTGGLLRVGAADRAPVAVRAELDALPIAERTGLPFSATGPVAHVCGHDVHVAALVAVTRTIARVGSPAPLLAVFQPREESAPSGAADVAVAPAFTGHRPRAILGVHVQPELPRGVVSVRPGAVNASADEIEIEVHGRGGHGGYPHRTRDPVLALAQVVSAVHHVVSRRVNPLEAGVLTIGQMVAGTAPNVIPETALARGTVRALDADREELLAAVVTVAENTARAYGCTAEVTVVPNEPAVVNDDALARTVATALDGRFVLDTTFRSCGADDFAHYGAVLPALMLFVGTTDPPTPPGAGPGLHHPEFSPDDAMVGEVARALLTAVVAAGAELADPATTTHGSEERP